MRKYKMYLGKNKVNYCDFTTYINYLYVFILCLDIISE